jgi:dTDP-4-amino-4,6-dideoxygalactose transaminase
MWVYNIYLDKTFPINRDILVKKLASWGIETRNSFVPINQQKVFLKKNRALKRKDCINANFIMKNGFYLPSGNNIKNQDIDFICNKIKEISKNE